MKGIYLTQEAKQEIEAMIAETERKFMSTGNDIYAGEVNVYKEILSSATILPVETESSYIRYVFDSSKKNADRFPNGLIIQPKQ
jgi:hypothetical protein